MVLTFVLLFAVENILSGDHYFRKRVIEGKEKVCQILSAVTLEIETSGR